MTERSNPWSPPTPENLLPGRPAKRPVSAGRSEDGFPGVGFLGDNYRRPREDQRTEHQRSSCGLSRSRAELETREPVETGQPVDNSIGDGR